MVRDKVGNPNGQTVQLQIKIKIMNNKQTKIIITIY